PGKRQENSDSKNVFVAIAEIKKSFGRFDANVGAKLKIQPFARNHCEFCSGARRSSAPKAAGTAKAIHERNGCEPVEEHDCDRDRKAWHNSEWILQKQKQNKRDKEEQKQSREMNRERTFSCQRAKPESRLWRLLTKHRF